MLNQPPLGLDASPDPLVLRLRTNDAAPDEDAQIVRVTASRCTIGGGEVCNLQVPGPEGLNCLIIRGRRYPVVRRWSPNALLNGQPFADAVLSPGDRLTVGAAEFEVLAADAATEPNAPVIEVATEPGGDMRTLALQHWEENDRLRAACAHHRARAQRLLGIARELERRLASRNDARSLLPAFDDSGSEAASAAAAEAAEVRFESTTAEAPVSASSLLMRMGAALPNQEEDAPTEPAPRTASREPVEPRPDAEERSAVARGERADADHSEDHEESIDTYMARLMDRVAQKKAKKDVLTYGEEPGPVAGDSAATAEDEPAEPSKPEPLTELPLRSVAPAERSANMSAMRELAKLNTHSLLDRHLRQTFFRSTIAQALVMVAATIAGIWLTRLSSHGAPVAIYPALVAFAFAIVWGFNYLIGVKYVLSPEHSAAGADLAGKLDEAIAAKALGHQPARNRPAPTPPEAQSADASPAAPRSDEPAASR
ncbi:MAG: hypothetical protein HYX69_21350 [Planctomycetia bacterium]|nr:hypothetical protein [Planctomycetia bacterium]